MHLDCSFDCYSRRLSAIVVQIEDSHTTACHQNWSKEVVKQKNLYKKIKNKNKKYVRYFIVAQVHAYYKNYVVRILIKAHGTGEFQMTGEN